MQKILECEFVPGAMECLEALRSRALLFVASGTPQEELELIVARRGLTPLFTEVWGTPLGKSEIIRSILDRHRIEPHEAVLIGDGISDYRAAAETGVPFLARDAGANHADWKELGATAFPDLERILLHIEGSGVGVEAFGHGCSRESPFGASE
jgi:phosphoglycolate phosphatase-like HAD superfamily hydrolase